MKTLIFFFIIVAAGIAEAREQWRVARYADNELSVPVGLIGYRQIERRNSWLPRVTPGWPLRGGKWLIKWEGTF